MLENVPINHLKKLNEREILDYVERKPQSKNSPGGIFRGKSLCINIEATEKLHHYFERVNKNFYYFVLKLNRVITKMK